ncbi:hypothetical protein FOCC_FOCC013532 [Frankliniella occidentalis]|nr:hypothetical protein FOCC_FOCC013532 [Frankliniella occidentalis]
MGPALLLRLLHRHAALDDVRQPVEHPQLQTNGTVLVDGQRWHLQRHRQLFPRVPELPGVFRVSRRCRLRTQSDLLLGRHAEHPLHLRGFRIFQPRRPGAAALERHPRPGLHQVGHGAVFAGRLHHLLLQPVEGHLYVWQSRVVHGALPLRRARHPPRARRHAAGLRRGHQVLPQPQFLRHHQGGGVGGRCNSGVFLSRTRIWGATGVCLLQQVPQQRVQGRAAHQLHQLGDQLRERLRHLLGAGLHVARVGPQHRGRGDRGPRAGVHRVPGRHLHHAGLHLLGAHLLHDAAHPGAGQLVWRLRGDHHGAERRVPRHRPPPGAVRAGPLLAVLRGGAGVVLAGRLLLLPPVGPVRGGVLHAVRRALRVDRRVVDLRDPALLRRHQGHDRLRTWAVLARLLALRGPDLPDVYHRVRVGGLRAPYLRELHLPRLGQRPGLAHRGLERGLHPRRRGLQDSHHPWDLLAAHLLLDDPVAGPAARGERRPGARRGGVVAGGGAPPAHDVRGAGRRARGRVRREAVPGAAWTPGLRRALGRARAQAPTNCPTQVLPSTAKGSAKTARISVRG